MSEQKLLIKEYGSWILSTSPKQHTLGSALMTCKRMAVENISELELDEWLELQQMMRDYETALAQHKDFRPARINYMQLGNQIRHLHFHGLPRYQETRLFAGQTWS